MQKINRIIIISLLLILPISSSLCIDMYLPAFPSIAKSFNINLGLVNLSMGIYLLGLAIGQLFYGLAADRFGRRHVLIIGLLIFIMGSVICYLSSNYSIFILGRGIQSLGSCSCIVLSRTIVSDLYDFTRRTKMLGMINALNIISPGIAPLLGSYFLTYHHWQAIFLAITLFGMMLVFLVFLFLPETLSVKDRHPLSLSQFQHNIHRLFSHKLFLGYLVGVSMMYGTVFVWVNYSPNILINIMKINPLDFGFYFIIPAIGSFIGALVIVKYTQNLSISKTISFSYALIFIAICLLMIGLMYHYHFHPLTITLIIATIFFSNGIIQPLQINSAITPFLSIAGFTTGIIGFCQGVTGALVSAITGIFNEGILGLSLVITITCMLAILGSAFALSNQTINTIALADKNLSH